MFPQKIKIIKLKNKNYKIKKMWKHKIDEVDFVETQSMKLILWKHKIVILELFDIHILICNLKSDY